MIIPLVSSYSKEIKEVDTQAPKDKILNIYVGNDYFLNNRKFQESINKCLDERDACFKEVDSQVNPFDFKIIIGGLTISLGLGILLGLSLN